MVARLAETVGVDAVEGYVENDEGWDSTVYEINGEWIVRVPRREEIRQLARREVQLLDVIRETLPVAVPDLQLYGERDGTFVAYPKIDGERITDALAAGADAATLGRELGSFLAALHRFPTGRAVEAGVPDTSQAGWISEQRAFAERCRRDVYPLLEATEQALADRLFSIWDSVGDSPLDMRLVHADLGPAHLLCRRGHLCGVIDWSDAQLGDPAIDFGWAAYGAGGEFAAALWESYEDTRAVDEGFRARALRYHQLGPWFEVLYGLHEGKAGFVASGLAGVRARLNYPS